MRLLLTLLSLALSLGCPAVREEGDESEGEGEGEGEDIGEGEEGDVCAFNADCGAGLRCGCEDGVCACEVGVRGSGENGVDVCSDSAVCAEDAEGTFTCSGVCADDSDCGPRLPRCIDVAFVGRICVR